jgi:hypothetical protein
MTLAAPADVDVSGKWTGSFVRTGPEGNGDTSPALLVLKQTGGEITGTAGPNDGEQHPLTKGTISGDKVTIEIQHESQSIRLDLVVSGDKMKGEIKMSREGQTRTGKLEVERAK